MLLLPFVGGLFCVSFLMICVSFESWPVQILLFSDLYAFFGGSILLSVVMNGYITDVTKPM